MLVAAMSNSGEEAPSLDEFHILASQRQLYERNLKDVRALMVEYEMKVLECRRTEEEHRDLIREIQVAKDIELEEKRNIFKQLDVFKMFSMCHICNTQTRNAMKLSCTHFTRCEKCLELSKRWSGIQACLMCRDRDQQTDLDDDSDIHDSV
ncbi:hypothetical protein R1flu_008471 [Riccia fluitans]|uniref:RING-type domain-containing protein n=1 Tax=Riccia fluitans TaxID=41844 RepID=A0ABD1YC39_9MARC